MVLPSKVTVFYNMLSGIETDDAFICRLKTEMEQLNYQESKPAKKAQVKVSSLDDSIETTWSMLHASNVPKQVSSTAGKSKQVKMRKMSKQIHKYIIGMKRKRLGHGIVSKSFTSTAH